jgi:hypothetical protein
MTRRRYRCKVRRGDVYQDVVFDARLQSCTRWPLEEFAAGAVPAEMIGRTFPEFLGWCRERNREVLLCGSELTAEKP